MTKEVLEQFKREAEELLSLAEANNAGDLPSAEDQRRIIALVDRVWELEHESQRMKVEVSSARVKLFAAILKNLDLVGVEDTLDWIKSRGKWEIGQLRGTDEK